MSLRRTRVCIVTSFCHCVTQTHTHRFKIQPKSYDEFHISAVYRAQSDRHTATSAYIYIVHSSIIINNSTIFVVFVIVVVTTVEPSSDRSVCVGFTLKIMYVYYRQSIDNQTWDTRTQFAIIIMTRVLRVTKPISIFNRQTYNVCDLLRKS